MKVFIKSRYLYGGGLEVVLHEVIKYLTEHDVNVSLATDYYSIEDQRSINKEDNCNLYSRNIF